MKAIKYILSAGIVLLMAACELDNFEGPDAQVYGSLIDASTGELIEQEIGTTGEAASIQVIEHGYSIKKVQGWKIKTNGEYRNNLVFSGTYDIIMNNGNFVKLDTIKGYSFHSGENKLDFKLVPNIRIKNAKVEKSGTAIVATFNLEYGHAKGKVKQLALFAQSDEYPSKSFHLAKTEANVADENITLGKNQAIKDRVFKLTLDLQSDEGKKLKAGKKYFFRIGAVATDLGDGVQEKFNYAPVVGITM